MFGNYGNFYLANLRTFGVFLTSRYQRFVVKQIYVGPDNPTKEGRTTTFINQP